jgi:hypothetical protein
MTSNTSLGQYSLVTANIDGNISILPNVVAQEKATVPAPAEEEDINTETANIKKKKKSRAILDDDDEDEDDGASDDMEIEDNEDTKTKKEAVEATDSVDIAKKQLGFDNEADEVVDEAKEVEKFLNSEDNDDGNDNDDGDFDTTNAVGPGNVPIDQAVTEVFSEMELRMQNAFQPSSTSGIQFQDTGRLARRWLCWNPTGTISSRREEGHCSIDIEFSDASKGRSIRIMDKYFFTMAALSRKGAIFASPKRDAVPGTCCLLIACFLLPYLIRIFASRSPIVLASL